MPVAGSHSGHGHSLPAPRPRLPHTPLPSSSDFPVPPTHSLHPTPSVQGLFSLSLGRCFRPPSPTKDLTSGRMEGVPAPVWLLPPEVWCLRPGLLPSPCIKFEAPFCHHLAAPPRATPFPSRNLSCITCKNFSVRSWNLMVSFSLSSLGCHWDKHLSSHAEEVLPRPGPPS